MGGAQVHDQGNSSASDLQPEYPRVCRFLQDTDNLAAEDALIDALPKVSPPVASILVKVTLNRGHERGLLGLVHVYHLLPAPEQRRLAGMGDRMSGALRAAMAEPGSKQRVNAISLIRDDPGARNAYLLATAMCDSAAAVSQAAAQALAALVSAHVEDLNRTPSTTRGEADQTAGRGPGENCAAGDRPATREQYLLEAVRQALHTFHVHRQEGAVEAAMQLAGCSPASFEALFGNPPARVSRSALDLLRSRSDPAWVGFAFQALASKKWRESVARAISERVRPAFVVGMIRECCRIGPSGLPPSLRSVKKLAWLRNGAAPLLSLPRELMESAVRFIMALGLPVATKADLMRELVLSGPPAIQKDALRALISERHDPTGKLLRTVASWGDPVLSPMAQRALPVAQDFVLPGTLGAGHSLPLVGAMDRPVGFEAFWSRFEQSTRAECLHMAEASRGGPQNFEESLRLKCRSLKPAERLRAISALRCLQLEAPLSAEIMRLARDEDRVVRSAALSALSHSPGPVNRRLLLEALQDHDSRVQANAIEALDRLGYDHELTELEHRLNQANNRVRANLGRAFLRIRPEVGAETLAAMLSSPDRSCRISGLWAIQDRGLRADEPVGTTLRNWLEAMARTEPDPQIRRRATSVLTGSTAAGSVPGDFFEEFLPCTQ